MDTPDLQQTLAEMSQNVEALKENQFALVAQVQVLQAALASALMHHPDRKAVLAAFERYMKVAKDSAPTWPSGWKASRRGMLSLLGKHQA